MIKRKFVYFAIWKYFFRTWGGGFLFTFMVWLFHIHMKSPQSNETGGVSIRFPAGQMLNNLATFPSHSQKVNDILNIKMVQC